MKSVLWPGILFLAFLIQACTGPEEIEPLEQGEPVSFDVDHGLDSDQMGEFMASAEPYPIPMYDAEADEEATGQSTGQTDDESDHPIEMEAQFSTPDEGQLSTIAQEVPGDEIFKMPAITSGKLFFVQNGRPHSCSANLVGSPDVIVTAGHCVFAEGGRSTEIMFVPLYGHPFGHIKAKRVHTHSLWTEEQARNYDWAVIELESPVLIEGGGRLGYYINHPPDPDLKATAYGYPANAPFDGQELFKADGDVMMIRLLPHVYMKRNDMTQGSSGGAWVKDGQLIGINAWRVRGKDDYVYSPKLETAFCNALDQAGVACQ